jgi:hypothetical protein
MAPRAWPTARGGILVVGVQDRMPGAAAFTRSARQDVDLAIVLNQLFDHAQVSPETLAGPLQRPVEEARAALRSAMAQRLEDDDAPVVVEASTSLPEGSDSATGRGGCSRSASPTSAWRPPPRRARSSRPPGARAPCGTPTSRGSPALGANHRLEVERGADVLCHDADVPARGEPPDSRWVPSAVWRTRSTRSSVEAAHSCPVCSEQSNWTAQRRSCRWQ